MPRHVLEASDLRAKRRCLPAVERAWGRALAPCCRCTRAPRIAEIRVADVADVRLSARKGELHLVGRGEKSRTVLVHPKLG